MGHHSELWYEAAQFLVRMSRDLIGSGDMIGGKKLGDEAADFYRRATDKTKGLMKDRSHIFFCQISPHFRRIFLMIFKSFVKNVLDP